MPVDLERATKAAGEAEFDGHSFALRPDQYLRMLESGILSEVEGVELRDGFLRLKPAEGGSRTEEYRLSVDQYRAMAREDILTADDRVELLEGWLVAKMTKYPPHEIAKGLAQDGLTRLVPAGWFVAIETPIAASGGDPEPDLVIVRGTRRDYPERPPGSGHVALVVEVADASLPRDRSQKKRLYARSGFPTYWLVNLVAGRIEVYSDPTGPTENPDYLHRQDFKPGDTIPVIIEGREIGRIGVGDLLP